MIVPYSEYEKIKSAFFKKHKGLMKVNTSSLQNGAYHKEYIASDGGVFFEVNSVEYVETVINLAKISVKMFKTEFFNTDNSKSFLCYQSY